MLNVISWIIIGLIVFLSIKSLVKETRDLIARRKEKKKGDVNGGSNTDTV